MVTSAVHLNPLPASLGVLSERIKNPCWVPSNNDPLQALKAPLQNEAFASLALENGPRVV